MDNKRLKQIINNILAQVANFTDMDKTTYYSWLQTEVGVTKEELDTLNAEGYLPVPIDYELENE